jgi:hypothetical protein
MFLQQPVPSGISTKKGISALQDEVALINLNVEPADGVVVYSDKATTCCILLVRCELTARVLIAHISTFCSASADELAVHISHMRAPQLYLVGAFDDRRGMGAALLEDLLMCLHQELPVPIAVRLCCCGALNTTSRRLPVVQGLAFCSSSRTLFCPLDNMFPGVINAWLATGAEC